MKCRASIGMSPGRSRSGGIVIGKHRQPEVEILAELPRGDRRLQVPVGRRDDPHVDVQRRRAADALEASSPRARAGSWPAAPSGRSPISSRNSVPRCASSNLPGLRCDGAGERALLVAEQLGLEQRFGNRGAVDGDERAVGARARARAARARTAPCRCRSRLRAARSRRSRAARCSATDHLLQLRRPRRRSAARRGARPAPPSAGSVLGRQPPLRERALDHQQQMVGIDRLGEEVERAFLHRRHRVLDAAERGHHDDRQLADRAPWRRAARRSRRPPAAADRTAPRPGWLASSAASASG